MNSDTAMDNNLYMKEVASVKQLFINKGVQPEPCARAMAEVVIACRAIGFRWMLNMLLDVWGELNDIDAKRQELTAFPVGRGKE